MNTNLYTRCVYVNQIKKYLFKKAIYSKINYEHFLRSISNCTCVYPSTKTNLTLNQFNKNHKNALSNNNTILADISKRFCSTKGPPVKSLPPLMQFPEIVWPSIIKSLRNFILTTFIIKPYFDKEFNIPDFVSGSKQAVEVVSNKISEGEINALDDLVDESIIKDLQNSVSKMSLSQRQQIAINKNDIYFSFPYQIGVLFEDEKNTVQKRFVEITMVYHIFRGLEGLKNRGEDLPLNVGMLPQYRDNISICNYRFIREFTKGVEGQWTINLLNHFKPSDYIE